MQGSAVQLVLIHSTSLSMASSSRPPVANANANEAAPEPTPSQTNCPPQTLVLRGQSIHAESQAWPPLYLVDRGISSLGHSTSQVALERVIASAQSISADPANVSKLRSHHIYNLKHLTKAPGGLAKLPSHSPQYYIQRACNKGLGSYGIKKSSFRPQWKALPLDTSGKHTEYGLAKFVKDGTPIFQYAKLKDAYTWEDDNGDSVAVESIEEDLHQLHITAELANDMLDALVGLWCCRIWQQSADTRDTVHEGIVAGRKCWNRHSIEMNPVLTVHSKTEAQIRQNSSTRSNTALVVPPYPCQVSSL